MSDDADLSETAAWGRAIKALDLFQLPRVAFYHGVAWCDGHNAEDPDYESALAGACGFHWVPGPLKSKPSVDDEVGPEYAMYELWRARFGDWAPVGLSDMRQRG